MLDYKKLIKDREFRLQLIRLLAFIPTKPYLRLVFYIKTGKKLNLSRPTGFNEKLNWLKVHDIHPEYTRLVDKLSVRDVVAQELGEEYLIPILGVWDSFDEVDFDLLPDEFVLKCNHDSGSVKIIRDKKNLNKSELREFFNKRLKLNSFCLGREYPYKEVKPKLYAEKLMGGGKAINDYKFFCFDGKPKIMFVATDRDVDCKFDFFDMDFNHLDIVNIHPQSGKTIAKPERFAEMRAVAEKLSKGMRFVRIDLYEIDGRIYFGEFTFFHGGGFYLFSPEKWETELGKWLELPEQYK